MGADRSRFPVLVAAAILAACSERPNDMPTTPSFAAKTNTCNTSTLQQLVADAFTGTTRTNVDKLVKALGQYRGAGDASNATYVGYKILDSISGPGLAQGTPHAGSVLTAALLPCMVVGGAQTPDSFTLALHTAGAYAVRGWSALDARPVTSHDSHWLLQPQDTSSWRAITTLDVTGLADSTAALFLAFGVPKTATGFTNDVLASTVFDWATIPTATFTPGVLVAECTTPLGYIQHNAAASAELLGYIPAVCPEPIQQLSWVERLFGFFRPEPLHAAAFRIGSAGSRGTLSPFGKVDPVEVNLRFVAQPSKGGNSINHYLAPAPALAATSKGGTPIGNSVFVWLEAFTNSGVFVTVCNNWAYTDVAGVARFPHAYVNKAGGYKMVAKAHTAAGAPPLPLKAAPATLLFNVKNSAAPPLDNGCTGVNVYVDGLPLPSPAVGPPPVTP